MTRNYIISKAPDAETILQLVESRDDVEALWKTIAAAVNIAPDRVQRLAQELWAHLNLCLTGAARQPGVEFFGESCNLFVQLCGSSLFWPSHFGVADPWCESSICDAFCNSLHNLGVSLP